MNVFTIKKEMKMNKNFDEIIVTIYEEEWNDAVTESDPDDYDYDAGEIITDDNGEECILQSVISIYVEDNKILMKCIVDYFLN